MTIADLIRRLCYEQNISLSELSRQIGQTRQNLYKKMRRNTLTYTELKRIADVLGVKFEQSFILPNGKHLKVDDKLQ